MIRVIALAIEKEGRPPSIRELCEACGWRSTKTATEQIEMCLKKGLIQRETRKRRGVSLTIAGAVALGLM